MKKVVYTAVTGEYDKLKGVDYPEKDIIYICFTDNNFSQKIPKPWLHIKLPVTSLSKKDLARYCKLNPHLLLPQFSQSLWLDGNISILSNVSGLFDRVLSSNDVASYEHWWRDSVEQEFFACSRHGFDLAWQLQGQWKKYQKEGYKPLDFFENNVVFRNHMKPAVTLMQDYWWQEYLKGGKRDQYSFTYSAYKADVTIHSLGLHDPRLTKVYFDYAAHKSNKRGAMQVIRKIINRIYIKITGWEVEEPKRTNKLENR